MAGHGAETQTFGEEVPAGGVGVPGGGIHEAGSPSIGKKTNWNQLLFWNELLLSGGKALPEYGGVVAAEFLVI